MNVENIVGIYNLLKDRKEGTMEAYRILRKEYEKKYDTEWLGGVLSEEEKALLNRLKSDAKETEKLFQNFAFACVML